MLKPKPRKEAEMQKRESSRALSDYGCEAARAVVMKGARPVGCMPRVGISIVCLAGVSLPRCGGAAPSPALRDGREHMLHKRDPRAQAQQ